jgi:hypothetical protein
MRAYERIKCEFRAVLKVLAAEISNVDCPRTHLPGGGHAVQLRIYGLLNTFLGVAALG